MNTNAVAKCDKKGSKNLGVYTDKEHEKRMKQIYAMITKEERLEDGLREVKSFFIATRDGHYHKLTTDEAIERLDNAIEYLIRANYLKSPKQSTEYKYQCCTCGELYREKPQECSRCGGEAFSSLGSILEVLTEPKF